MGGRIALHVALARPERVARLILIGASPGLADPRERADRRAADAALADEIEAGTLEAFARRWAQTPVLAGLPAAVAAAGAGRPDALHPDRAGRGAARPRDGNAALAVGPTRRARDSGDAGRRRARREVPGDRGADGRSRCRRVELAVVPAVGHAVHLEAPEVVAGLIGS